MIRFPPSIELYGFYASFIIWSLMSIKQTVWDELNWGLILKIKGFEEINYVCI